MTAPAPGDTAAATSAACATPVRHPVMVQRWSEVVFLHWRYDPTELQQLLPRGVTVDTFDGSAWVGLVPFRMEGLGLPGLAPLPFVGSFPEVNVRTYVRSAGRRSVYFFSLDIDRLLPVAVARAAYRLPYCLARVDHARAGNIVVTRVERRWPRRRAAVGTQVAVRIGAPIPVAAPLVEFLTARWALISATQHGRLRHAPVSHAAWPLHEAEALHVDDDLVAAVGLSAPVGPPHVLWSPGVDVRVGRPTRLDGSAGEPRRSRPPSISRRRRY